MPLTRMLAGAVVTALLGLAVLPAQTTPRSRVYSHPALPSTEALKRLNLTMAWRAYVPMDGRRDGLQHVELHGRDLFVLTRSGLIQRMDAEKGTVYWKKRVGKPYTLMPFFAANSRGVAVVANITLYGLNRATGNAEWDYRLRAGVSAQPVADEEQIYVPGVTGRMSAFYLPFVTEGGGTTSSPVYSERVLRSEARPEPVWDAATTLTLGFKPLQTAETVFVIGLSGDAMGFTKVIREGASSAELYRFSTEGKVTAPPGQYGDTGYVGSDDGAIYAINLLNGKLRWRHTTGSTIRRRPASLEKDVFVVSRHEGMARVDRETGDSMWRVPAGRRVTDVNVEADQFLAANGKYVYANDRSGRLLVLDRKRGTRLSMLDTSAFKVPIVNELTDRLYLAANDGLIVCLRDRDQTAPIRHRARLEEAASPTRKILDAPITEKATKGTPLRDVLAKLRVNYKVRFVIATNAFKRAGMTDVQDRQVDTPTWEDKPLKDYLQRVLNQVKATYLLREDTVLIVPGKPEAK
jgi:outer membrane protein assembly factor BamB